MTFKGPLPNPHHLRPAAASAALKYIIYSLERSSALKSWQYRSLFPDSGKKHCSVRFASEVCDNESILKLEKQNVTSKFKSYFGCVKCYFSKLCPQPYF